MNKERRAQLSALRAKLEGVRSTLRELHVEAAAVYEEEEVAFSNLPESLQGGDREEVLAQVQEVADAIEGTSDTLDEVFNVLSTICQE